MSTPEITITLGRSGQVVKRKRADFAQSLSYHSKRLRAVVLRENVGHDGENGFHLARNDLRHKLIERRRLSRKNRTAARGNELMENFKGEFSGAPARSSITNVLQHGPQSQRVRHFQRDPYREATRYFSYMDFLKKNSSTVTRDDLRQKFPARPAYSSGCLLPPTHKPEFQKVTYNSGCLLPPTHKPKMQKVTSMKSIDPLGSRYAYSNTFPGPPRSTVPAHVMALMESERARPMALFPSPSGFMPRSSFMVEAPVTVDGLLNTLGLGKYAINFQSEEVDMSALKQMDEKDLKDLGVLMGPRKKILQALSALTRRQLPRQL